MILATDLQAIIAGAKRPARRAGSAVRVTVYKTWTDKGETLAILRAAMLGGALVSVGAVLHDNPRLKARTVEKALHRLEHDGEALRVLVSGRVFWKAAA